MREVCKILVIGAGGLGCELLKDLVSKYIHFKVVYCFEGVDGIY